MEMMDTNRGAGLQQRGTAWLEPPPFHVFRRALFVFGILQDITIELQQRNLLKVTESSYSSYLVLYCVMGLLWDQEVEGFFCAIVVLLPAYCE